MKCPLCGTDIIEHDLIGPYLIHQDNIKGTKESGTIQVCGRCFLLTSILDTLKEIKKVINNKIKKPRRD